MPTVFSSARGRSKVVLYDSRRESPTFGMVNEICRSDLHRNLMVIPAYVFHAHQNIGTTDATLVSMPTRADNYEFSDVYRFPITSDAIPYQFDERLGW